MKDELLRLAFHVAHDFSRISIFMIAVKLVVPNGWGPNLGVLALTALASVAMAGCIFYFLPRR